MRDSLTVFAIGVIFVLTAALVGPYLVDWSRERSFVETRLSDALGARARIDGDIDLKLLPTPYFVVEDITISDAGAAASATPPASPGWRASARKMRLEIALAPLMRGEVDFVEARLEQPRFETFLGPDGSPPAPPDFARAPTRFEKISISDGAISIVDGERKRAFEIAGLELEAEAGSLRGPFKGRGEARIAGERVAFRVAAGAPEDDAIKLKLSADVHGAAASFDGALALGAGEPTLAGAVEIGKGSARATAALTATRRRAVFDAIEASAGVAPQAIAAKGSAELDFSGPLKGALTLSSEQIDLDRWLAAAALAPEDLRRPPFPLVVNYAAKSLILGDAAFADLVCHLVFGETRPDGGGAGGTWLRLEARGPHESQLFLDGAADFRPPEFRGRLQFASKEAGWVAPWLRSTFGALAPAWPPQDLSVSAIDLSADAVLSPRAAELRHLDLAVDGAHVRGAIVASFAEGAPPRIDAELTAPSLNVGDLKRVFQRGVAPGALDGSLRLETPDLRLSDAPSLGDFSVVATRTGARTEIEQLTLENSDGAAIAASGLLAPDAARIEATLKARSGSRLAATLGAAGAGATADFALSRAAALLPLDLRVVAEAARNEAGLALKSLSADGALGGATIVAKVEGDPGVNDELALSAVADWRDGRALMTLAGLAAAGAGDPGRAHVEIRTRGSPREASQAASVVASLGPARFNFDGRVGVDLSKPTAQGALAVATPDAAPFLRALGAATPDFRKKTPISIKGNVSLDSGGLRLEAATAELDSAAYSGSLAYDPSAAIRLTGTLEAETISAGALFGLVLGPPEPAKAGALWSSLAFAAPSFELPNAHISLAARRMALGPLLSHGLSAAQNARLALAAGPGRLDFQSFSFDLGGARVSGDLKLRRASGEASLASRLVVAGAALDLPGARGRLDATLDVSSTGKSADALAAGLAGSGEAQIHGLIIPRMDPGALARVVTTFDREGRDLGAKAIAAKLAAELERGDLDAGDRAFSVAVASGALSLASAGEAASAPSLSAAFDLRRGLLTQRVGLVDAKPPRNWTGEPPRATATIKGPLAAPRVEVDAAALSNALANRAIEREAARIEAFEFDLRERAFFYHRLASERRREAERERAEHERAAAEAAQKEVAPTP